MSAYRRDCADLTLKTLRPNKVDVSNRDDLGAASG
jgi:hypothetical protein